MDQLEADIRREPRPINEEEFVAKKPWEGIPEHEEFKSLKEREENFALEQRKKMDNKLEQQERMQLFYILEQFY